MTAVVGRLRALRQAASWHRRLLAAGLAAGSVAAGLHAIAPPAPASTPVLIAHRDLPGGSVLAEADLRTARLPAALAPASVVPPGADLGGAVLAAPLAAGETLTTTRLVGPSLLESHGEGMVGVPVRLADAAVTRLLHAGDRIDVLAADGSGVVDAGAMSGAARVVASAVRVVAVLPDDSAGAFAGVGGAGALVVVAATPDVAADLTGAEATARLSVALRPR